MSDRTDQPVSLPSTTLDVAEYPDFLELVDEVLRRLAIFGSLVIADPAGRAFPGFLIHWWRGVHVVRGPGQRHLGTFASIEPAIRAGLTAPPDHGAGDEHADALA